MATTFSGEAAIEALYVGYFGRAGDPAGTSYWVGQLNGGLTITQIAASFSVQAESKSLYPFLANPNVGGSTAITNFVNSVYQDLFNRAPDSAGAAYWTAQLQAANGSPQAIAQFILNVITGAQGTDQTIIQNKVSVAQFFTDTLATSGGQYNAAADSQAHSLVQGTTGASSGPGSVAAQDAAASAFISGNASVGTPITLTTGVDSVSGSNLAISGVIDQAGKISTLQVFDSLNPTGTNNSLTATWVNGAAAGQALSSSNLPVLNNIQTFNLTDVNGAAVGTPDTVTLTGIAPNLTTLGVVGGTSSVTFQGFSGAQVNTFNVTNFNPGAAATLTFTPNTGSLTSGGAATGSATINLSGDAALAGAGVATVVISGGGPTDGYSTVTLNSNGTVTNDLAALTDSALKTLNVAGATAVKVDGSIAFNGNVNIQAGTDTGGLNLDVSGNITKVTFAGGTAGTETLKISEASLIATGTSLTGGAGTSDTLSVGLTAANLTADYAALNKVTGFEILGVTTNVVGGIDDSQITAAFNNHFALSGAANAETISNLVNNATVDVLFGGGTDVLSGAIGAQTINVNVGAASSIGIAETLNLTGWATVNATSNGTAANTITFLSGGNQSINLSGSDGATVTLADTGATGDAFNASAFTGTLTNLNDTGKGDLISTGSGTSTITETGKADTITYLSGHTTVDKLISFAGAAGYGSTTNFDKVTNFVVNQDVLANTANPLVQGTSADLTGVTNGTGVVVSSTYASSTAFINAAEAVGGTAGHTVAWSDGTNTWVAEFDGTAGHAHIVELVGVNTITSVGGTGAGHLQLA